tara:strand:+ start:1094 stop:1915 length:822 start_codon:yes stop_codon:yes gene_type:complete
MRSNINNRIGTIDDNFINTYINYISENQRLYRYIVENSDNNERFLTSLLNERLRTWSRTRPRSSNTSYYPNRNIPRNFNPRHNVDRSYINPDNHRNNINWFSLPNTNNQTFFPFTPNLNFLTPVNVSPTNEEINNATSVMSYNSLSSDIRERIGNYCIITAGDLSGNNVMRINQCGHYFSETGLRRHFETSVRCPICRFDIRDSNHEESEVASTVDISSNIPDISNNLSGIREEMMDRLRNLFEIPSDNDINSDIEFDICNNNITLSYSFYTI